MPKGMAWGQLLNVSLFLTDKKAQAMLRHMYKGHCFFYLFILCVGCHWIWNRNRRFVRDFGKFWVILIYL